MKILEEMYSSEGNERAGVVLASGEVLELANISPDPKNSFEIPVSKIQKPGVVGTWHTHPGDTSNLSVDDYVSFLEWPDLLHFVVGRDGVRCFAVRDGVVFQHG